jgi:hypothetical protein
LEKEEREPTERKERESPVRGEGACVGMERGTVASGSGMRESAGWGGDEGGWEWEGHEWEWR